MPAVPRSASILAPRPSFAVAALVAIAALVAFAACGGAQPEPPASTAGTSKTSSNSELLRFLGEADPAYIAACRKAAADHDVAVKELLYLPPDLKTVAWPLPVSPDSDGLVHEAALLDGLRAAKVRVVLVQARGGIGKTELSKTLVAELCGQVPTFRVDLPALYAMGVPATGGNPLVTAFLAQLKLDADQTETMHNLLESGRWLLVLDAIEEVATATRPAVLVALSEVRTKYPNAQVVVMARPSIYEKWYTLQGLDAVLELPPLDCGRARSSLVRMSEDDAERHRIANFVATWHLDRQSLLGQQCYFPYLATYRDIQVVQRLSKSYDPNKDEMGGLQATLTQVHEAIIAERLQKELAHLQWTGDQVLAAVDAMVAKGGFVDGNWDLLFTTQRCLDSQPGGDNPQNRQVCEKIFQSVLFERIAGTGEAGGTARAEWKFGHQAVADLFVARWIESALARTPSSCAAVEQQADMFDGKEVAGYLAGRPQGARCLVHVTRAMCKAGGFKKTDVALLYKGLPLGATRAGFVKAAREFESKNGADACVTKTLAAL